MILTEDDIKKLKGLSDTEAQKLLKADGYNELPSAEKRNIFKIIAGVFKEPMFFLLIASSMVYLFLGNVDEAIILMASVFLILGITIYQENKTENALEALRNMASPRALVIRNGEHKRIPGREVVKGDVVIIKEGDRVPADAVLLWDRNLLVDESLLTGESVPVRKIASSGQNYKYSRPGGDDLPFLYSGSLIVQGQGVSRVIATAAKTEMGKIGKALSEIKEEETPLQKQTGKIVRNIFFIVVLLCLVVVFAHGFYRGNWVGGILSGITLAMSILPEEFPVVLTVFLALGAWRIAQKKALVRRISAVEIIGASTVLCVDKTGTITENKMAIKKIFCDGKFYDISDNTKEGLPENFHELIEYGILASSRDPFDPMEKALKKLGEKTLNGTGHLHEKWVLLEEYPLSNELLALSHVWKSDRENDYIVSTKGAAEAVINLCHLSEKEKKEIISEVDAMAKNGLRVLGIAKSHFKKAKLPRSQHDFDFKFIGLIGLADPIRRSVPNAIRECYGAGIRVVMITGDYSATAENIAKEIGLKNFFETITGAELGKMNPWALKKKIEKVNVFSRVIPEQKLFLVDALKSNGEIVAMTGDGVNDAPALKAAHIGIAMGERGTDVARESADIVLLDDDFLTIVKAIRRGRMIYDNLKKAMAYIVSVHVPIAGITLIAVLGGWPAVIFPVHVVFLELLIDPACSVVFEAEPEEENIMKRSPRDPKKPLFGKNMLIMSFLQGVFSLIGVAAVFALALNLGKTEAEVRTMTFVTLVVSNIFLIFTNRSWSKNILSAFSIPNKSLVWIVSMIAIFLALAVYAPFLRKIFYFELLVPLDIIISLGAGILSVVWFEIVKKIYARKGKELLGD
ncbi:cation-translocating P-type ATPase [Patescibacteria group bacterium]|nr:cation-translocating P-type ATPase [Patescibacteria group bacterium]